MLCVRRYGSPSHCKAGGKARAVGAPFCLVALLLLLGVDAAAGAERPAFDQDRLFTNAGYVQVSWASGKEAGPYELQRAMSADFEDGETIYRGSEEAVFLSGLADGTYHFRVRQADQTDWSDPLVVEVEHVSQTLAFSMFALGILVVLATVGVVWRGARTHV